MTWKMLIALLCGALTVSVASAQTPVPGGDVYGTWTAGGSPYEVLGNITIPVDSTLTIEPAVEVEFQGDYSLTVNGYLEAMGTEVDSIHFFPADTSVGWDGIIFMGAPDSSHLVYCTISDGVGLICWGSSPVISRSTITSGYLGIQITIVGSPEISHCNLMYNQQGVYWQSSNSGTISDCIISHNSNLGGIWFQSSAELTLVDCIISDNTSNDDGAGVRSSVDGTLNLINCTISDNDAGSHHGGGVYCGNYGTATFTNCTINGNVGSNQTTPITLGGGGIALENASATLSYCTIFDNFSPEYGAGIAITNGNLAIDHCTIDGNSSWDSRSGISIVSGGTADITNSIISNNYDGYGIYNSGALTVEYTDFYNNAGGDIGGNVPPDFGVLDTVNTNSDSCDMYFNIFLDPLFADTANGDYQITWANFPVPDTTKSPCIDAGDPALYDPDGTICDMGALFFDQGGTGIPGGNVSGTWTVAGSPYRILGDITVHGDSTLTIEPGVEVEFQGLYKLTVQGWLEAVGTETDSIHFFPADTTTGWYGMHFISAQDSSHLSYCTIRYANNGGGTYAGAMQMENSNPVIMHGTISDNFGDIGGGIAIINSNPIISYCIISGNETGTCGGGLFLQGSNPMISYCTISDNENNEIGGGITASYTVGTFFQCSIVGNITPDIGAGVYIQGDSLTFSYCTFYNNSAAGQGGAVIIEDNGKAILDHCTIAENDALQGGGICLSVGGSLTLTNSIMQGNTPQAIYFETSTATITYSDFYNSINFEGTAVPTGLGILTQVNANLDSCDAFYNIFMDPLFVGGSDYHLTEDSPCIDAGDPLFALDPDSTTTDMGRYFYDQSVTGIEYETNRQIPDEFCLQSPYPNPFNPVTTFKVELPVASWVTIGVYDIAGRPAGSPLQNAWKQAGYHEVTFDAAGLASGVYVYRLEAGEFTASGKMVLMK